MLIFLLSSSRFLHISDRVELYVTFHPPFSIPRRGVECGPTDSIRFLRKSAQSKGSTEFNPATTSSNVYVLSAGAPPGPPSNVRQKSFSDFAPLLKSRIFTSTSSQISVPSS